MHKFKHTFIQKHTCIVNTYKQSVWQTKRQINTHIQPSPWMHAYIQTDKYRCLCNTAHRHMYIDTYTYPHQSIMTQTSWKLYVWGKDIHLTFKMHACIHELNNQCLHSDYWNTMPLSLCSNDERAGLLECKVFRILWASCLFSTAKYSERDM